MPTEIDTLVAFFKALADATRLRIVGLLAVRERSVDELAALCDVRPPTVSHHLARLRDLGLVDSRRDGTTAWYRLEVEALERMAKETLQVETLAQLGGDDAEDAFAHKVVRDFVIDGRLKNIPSSRKKREVILEWLVGQLDVEREYDHKALDAAIKAVHPDAATLRREMIGYGWLSRDDYGRAYRRTDLRGRWDGA